MSNIIYERVTKLIHEQRLTKAKVEAAAGLGNGVIEKWNSSKNGPTIESLSKVANVLGTTVSELTKEVE